MGSMLRTKFLHNRILAKEMKLASDTGDQRLARSMENLKLIMPCNCHTSIASLLQK